MIIDEDDFLEHYGTPRHSGRYPWGSGDNVALGDRRNPSFLDMVDDLKRQGLTESQIAESLGMKTTELRAKKTLAKNAKKQADIAQAAKLKATGMGNSAIGREMGINESSVRALLAPSAKEKNDILFSTAEMLKQNVAEKTYLDVGAGQELHVGVSENRFKSAVALLKEEGYETYNVPVLQLGTGKETTVKVLCPPGTKWGDVMRNRDSIRGITNFSEDGGRSYLGLHDPLSIDPKRVAVRYKEDGGAEADGVIYVRRGVKDISLGNKQYAQVRVKVGDGHYLKGMAMYKDDLPDGVDLMFNTNKSDTGNKLDALKKLGDDPANPFGAIVRQIVVRESDGKEFVTGFGQKSSTDGTEKVVSAMNLVNEEGDWGRWSKTLSSQMLSKQSPQLARQQLKKTYDDKVKDFEEITSLTNPTVRKKLLEEFAENTDASAVHLKAAPLPRQASHVILPISSMPPTQIYAPKYDDGTVVSLIRYPHGGTFEIPELVVNNKQREAKTLLKDAADAVGIHHSVAERLSGADFDGDTVLVIPKTGSGAKITSTAALEQLKGFDPKSEYKKYEGMPVLKPDRMQRLMGDVSNLITDMTIQGAPRAEIARAVRHSMVVIDAAKHELDYKRSEQDHGIKQLKAKYQGGARSGAETIISRKKSETPVPERKLRSAKDGGPVDPATGKLVYVETGRTYTTKDGKVVPVTSKVSKLELADDARTLMSKDGVGTPMERIYADHSNRLKTLANRARKDALNTPRAKQSTSAKVVYADEVKKLKADLDLARYNSPLERQAQIVANANIKLRLAMQPDMDKAQLKKLKAQALNEARNRVGAKKKLIDITPRQWEAIQAGAVSDSMLREILDNADIEQVKQYARPQEATSLSRSDTKRAESLLNQGYTRAEVARDLGISVSTLDRSMEGGEE